MTTSDEVKHEEDKVRRFEFDKIANGCAEIKKNKEGFIDADRYILVYL